MVKKVAWLGTLMLALPLAAFANSIDLSNAGGVIIGNSGGLALTGSTLIKYGSIVGTNLGIVTFTTVSGSAQLSSGNTNLKLMVPEPGTLSLFGTGLLGVAGFIRHKRRPSHL